MYASEIRRKTGGDNMTDREFLTYLQNIRDKQIEKEK